MSQFVRFAYKSSLGSDNPVQILSLTEPSLLCLHIQSRNTDKG